MNRLLVTAVLLTLSAPAFAQAPQQKPFVPFTVEEKAAQELQNWLNEQPFKFSAPVLQWLAVQEQTAQAAADKAKQSSNETPVPHGPLGGAGTVPVPPPKPPEAAAK